MSANLNKINNEIVSPLLSSELCWYF